jgi:hypothetical protein
VVGRSPIVRELVGGRGIATTLARPGAGTRLSRAA